jgi:zinc D-Ala-D-Ala carboxypeptidase
MRRLCFSFCCLSLVLQACGQQPAKTPIEKSPLPAATENVAVPKIDLAYLSGKFDPASHSDFVKIAPPYAERSDMYLRKEAYEDFKRMHAAALKEGINLKIISAARNFTAQKAIWEAKWSGARILSNGQNAATAYPDPAERALKIMEYSAMPGASRHHWGTDIDLNNLSDAWFLQGTGQKIYAWLQAHAAEYGFCQPYSPKGSERPDGYNEEKWHWTYLPLSKTFTEQARQGMKDSDISGFSGAETAVKIGVVKKYVLGIAKACMED